MITPTNLKELCATYGLSPSKAYGQNYLISDAPIQKMIEAAGIDTEDTVIEIGPGFGILTFALAQKAKKVIAFEIEKKLKSYWDEKILEFPNVEIIWGNVLKEFTVHHPRFAGHYTLVANLPYHITSNVFRIILEAEHKPKKIVVMVQKEVADRIVAKPGDMSVLAVSVQYYGAPRIVTKVAKGSFWPSPKVDSAVIEVDVKQTKTDNVTDENFFRIVKIGFSNKRKQLWRNLVDGMGLDKILVRNILKEVTGNEIIRAQELSVDDWKQVAGRLGIGGHEKALNYRF